MSAAKQLVLGGPEKTSSHEYPPSSHHTFLASRQSHLSLSLPLHPYHTHAASLHGTGFGGLLRVSVVLVALFDIIHTAFLATIGDLELATPTCDDCFVSSAVRNDLRGQPHATTLSLPS